MRCRGFKYGQKIHKNLHGICYIHSKKQNNVQIKFQHIEGILCERKKTREKEIDLL